MPETMLSQEHNRLQPINQIPPELLSQIFLLYDQATSYDREDPKNYVQRLAPAVCSHWRKVALETTALWTTIRIKKPVPCKRAELYLARSGPTVPLDIVILLMSPELPKDGDKPEELGTFARQARKSFSFLIEQGGSVSRWRKLTIGTDIFASFAEVRKFLASTNFPSLENFEFVFRGPWTKHPEDEKLFVDAYGGTTRPKPLFSRPPPQLRTVKIEGILHLHLFGNIARPQLVGLTDIYISFPGYHPGIHHIYSMLAANPGLTHLCFNSGEIYPDEPDDVTPAGATTQPRITLPDLVSLTFMHITHPIWNLSIIKTFQAPALQSLALSFWVDPDSCQVLVDYIADQGSKSAPYFPPTLTELSFFTAMATEPNPEPLLRAYPNITTLGTGNITALLMRPWLVPNLVNLDYATQDASEIKNLITDRCEDGLPLKKIEIRWFGDEGTLPLSLEEQEQLKHMVHLVISTREQVVEEEEESQDIQDQPE